jgi:hypothetical protein
VGSIVGGVFGAIACIVGVVLVWLWCRRRAYRRRLLLNDYRPGHSGHHGHVTTVYTQVPSGAAPRQAQAQPQPQPAYVYGSQPTPAPQPYPQPMPWVRVGTGHISWEAWLFLGTQPPPARVPVSLFMAARV